MKNIFITTQIVILLFSTFAFAAPTPEKASEKASEQWLRGPGIIRGGSAESFMSLLDIRRTQSSAQKTERLVLDWGNRVMLPTASGGYYQIEYQHNPERVMINLAQTLNTKFEPTHFKNKIGKALYIKEAKLDFDIFSQSQNLTLYLTKQMTVRVASLPAIDKNSTAKLIIDLVE